MATAATRHRRGGTGRMLILAGAIAVAVGAGCTGFFIVRLNGGHPASRLVFGIYPGGAAGTVGPRPETRPDDAHRRMLALKRLRGADRSFVVRLYTPYRGRSAGEAIDPDSLRQLRQYIAAAFPVELVLTYRPQASRGPAAVSGYVAFVRRVVRQAGRDPSVVSLQITNEVNVEGTLDASDGGNAGALDALVRGVVAAKQQARAQGYTHLKVGFSWAYQRGAGAEVFWHNLRRAGGRSFAGAVDWVGVDIYPGTWGPPLPHVAIAAGVRAAMIGALSALRRRYLPTAGIPAAAIHVAENGYPTGIGRTLAMQASVASAAIRAVDEVRGTYHVTDYRWFSLRDANSANPGWESHYGLMRDDYSPKPAFWTYRSLVAKLGATSSR